VGSPLLGVSGALNSKRHNPTCDYESAVDGPGPTRIALLVLAGFGCGVALAVNHLLFAGIFAAAIGATIIGAMRQLS
jgi:hypothetical protein